MINLFQTTNDSFVRAIYILKLFKKQTLALCELLYTELSEMRICLRYLGEAEEETDSADSLENLVDERPDGFPAGTARLTDANSRGSIDGRCQQQCRATFSLEIASCTL